MSEGDAFFNAIACVIEDSEQTTESICAQVERTLRRPVLKSHVMTELNDMFADGLIKRTTKWIKPGGKNERQVSMWRWPSPKEEAA